MSWRYICRSCFSYRTVHDTVRFRMAVKYYDTQRLEKCVKVCALKCCPDVRDLLGRSVPQTISSVCTITVNHRMCVWPVTWLRKSGFHKWVSLSSLWLQALYVRAWTMFPFLLFRLATLNELTSTKWKNVFKRWRLEKFHNNNLFNLNCLRNFIERKNEGEKMGGTRSAHRVLKGVIHFISDKTMAENFRRIRMMITNYIWKKWSTGICSGFRRLDKAQRQTLINKKNPNEYSGPISITVFLFSRREYLL